MKRYEYMVVNISRVGINGNDDSNFSRFLSNYGDEGWELVDIETIQNGTMPAPLFDPILELFAFFKREKNS